MEIKMNELEAEPCKKKNKKNILSSFTIQTKNLLKNK